jgi:hypothetical protein
LKNRRRHRHTWGENQRPHANTSRDEEIARQLQEEEEAKARSRQKAGSQMHRPQPGNLDIPQQQRPLSTSPHPNPNGRLPPGAHLDMRTGQVVTNMFPPDHPVNAQWSYLSNVLYSEKNPLLAVSSNWIFLEHWRWPSRRPNKHHDIYIPPTHSCSNVYS